MGEPVQLALNPKGDPMSDLGILRRPAALLAMAALLVACAALAVSLGDDAGANPLGKIGAVKERSKKGTALDGNFENVQARCPRHYESISGGVSMDPNQDGVVYESVKNEERGWSVGLRNPNDGGGAIVYFASVYCAKR
jgi:hypothetical protein